MLALMEKQPFVASDEEAVIAREAVARLRPIAEAKQDVRLRVSDRAAADVVVPLPARALELIVDVLGYMAEQKAVSFIPLASELTTQQAADLLNVSRPFLVSLLEKGEIPFRKVGAHRRVCAEHILAYKAKADTSRSAAMDRMAQIAQELDLD